MDIIQFLILDCYDPELLKIIYFIKVLLDIAFIVLPAGAIIMLSLDMAKNVIAAREDEMSKNFNVFIKRILSLACVFLVFVIVKFAMSFVGDAIGEDNDTWLTCWNNAELVTIKKKEAIKDFEESYNETDGTYEGWVFQKTIESNDDLTNKSTVDIIYNCEENQSAASLYKYRCDVYIPE